MPHVGRSCGDACWGSSGSAPLMSWFCGTFRAMPVSQAAGMSAGPLHRLAFLSVKIEEIGEKKNEGGKKKKEEKGEKERKNSDARYLRTRISCIGLDSEKQILSWTRKPRLFPENVSSFPSDSAVSRGSRGRPKAPWGTAAQLSAVGSSRTCSVLCHAALALHCVLLSCDGSPICIL